MRQHCPACGAEICSPSGKSESLLIIGEFPGKLEMERGEPFCSHPLYMTAGKVFRKELERCGMSLRDFRVCNLWLHEPTDNEDCYKAGYNHTLDEAKGKKAILLVGSDTVATFTKYKVSDVNGLEVDSHILSAPIIYAMTNPALALHRSSGEVKMAVRKFVSRLDEEGLI